MANTRFQHKRSTVSGVVPTTSDIASGELGINLADRRLFTSNGTAVFELGSNLTNLAVSANLTIGASGDLVFTNGAGIYANGSIGSSGQVLTSNGSGVYWSFGGSGVSTINTGDGLTGGPITATGTISVLANNGITSNSGGLFVTPGIGTVVNATGVHVNSSYVETLSANSATFLGNSSGTLANVASWITGNSATAYTNATSYADTAAGAAYANAVANAAALYQTTAGLSANVATLTANNATNLGGVAAASYVNTSGAYTITGIHTHSANIVMGNTTVNTQLSNATILISNATSTTTLGLADLRIGNTASNVIISNTVSSFPANLHVGNTTVNTRISGTTLTLANSTFSTTIGFGTSAFGGNVHTGNTTVNTRISGTTLTLANSTFSTTIGFGTSSFGGNVHAGNTTVNTQLSSSTILISNATSTTTLGLADLRVGNTTTNVIISNTVSTFGGNVSITGSANAANVTAALFTGNLTGTASNATNLNSQPGSFYTNASNMDSGTLPDARLSSAVVNTSGNFTVAGNINFTAANVNFANGLHVGANVDLTTTSLFIGNATVNSVISAGSILVNGINVEAAITGNAATAYANAVANAAALYQTTAGLSANVATLTANAAGFLGNSSGTLANIASWVTGNSSTAFTNATTFASNASNLTTGTLPNARLDSSVTNTSANFTITGVRTHQANIILGNTTVNTQLSNSAVLISNATSTTTLGLTDLRIGNTAVNVIISNTVSAFGGNVSITGSANAANVTAAIFTGNLTGTASNATNLNSQPGSFYTNATNITTGTLPWTQAPSGTVNTSGSFTITGVRTHQANIVLGNTTVNTQLSNAAVLISNATSTTTLGLADIRIGNTATNVVIANTTSSFGGNVSVTGSLTAANLTAALFTGNVTGTASNATNLNSQPGSFYTNATNISTGTLDNARLSAAVVNTSGNFTLGGNLTFQGTNNQFSTGFTVGSNVVANTTRLTVGNSSVFTSINSTAVNTSSLSTTGSASIGGNLTVTGNLTVNGSYVTVSGNAVVYSDNMLFLNQGVAATITNITGNGTFVVFTANNNYQIGWDVVVTGVNPASYNGTYLNITAANSTTFTVANTNTATYVSGGSARGQTEANPDLGIAAGYNDGTYRHAGFFRDASDGIWKVFDSYLPEPDTSVFIDTSNGSFNIAPFQANIIYVGNTTVFGTISTTNYSGTSNNATNFGGLSLATVQSQITGNAATAYANAVANAAALYQTTAGLSANVATLTANAAGFLGNSSGTLANVASWITGNSATAFTNATTFASNASNLTTGTLPDARLSAAVVNTSGNFTVAGNINFTAANVNFANGLHAGANVDLTTTSLFIGNTTVNTNITAGQVSISGVTVNSTIYQGTANNANNLNGQPGSFYTNATNITTGILPWAQAPSGTVNTSGSFTFTGLNTFQANLHTGNTTVNTQLSNATILISNATTTTALGLADLRIGNTTTNVVIANTVSTFGGNVSITGSANAANVTASVFTGNLTGTASNATNLNSQPGSFYTNATNISAGTLANARLPSAIDVTSVNAATLSVGTNFIANSTVFRTISTLLVPGSSGEGGQIVMGYGNNLATTITGQNNNTFNIDVFGGNTGSTPLLRIFTQNGDGSTTAILNAANTGRVHIGSTVEQTDSTFKVTGTANITSNAAVGGALTAANVTATVFTGSLTGTASNATNLNSQPGSFYTNATNITTGTLPWAQAPSGTVNTSGAFTITGIYTHSANIVMGNTTVNTQHSNATILISNATSTTTLGLTDLRIGNTATNVVIANTTSSFGGNVSVTGAISSANVTATLFTGSLTGTASNATNLNNQPGSFYTNATNLTTGTLPDSRLSAAIVNTSGAFTITGTRTFNANVTFGSAAALIANSSPGTTGQVLTSNGTGLYWSTVSGVNTAAQYAWTNTHTFAANVNFDSGTLFVDATNNRVGIVNSTPGSSLTVNGDVAANFFVNPTTITASYTIPTNFNAMSAGPITVGTGAIVTVPNGSTWTIV